MTSPSRFIFIGVSPGGSSIRRIFPRWMQLLGIDAVLEGCDMPLGASIDAYRRVVMQIRDQPDICGALVTSHKIDLLRSAHDLIDSLDAAAEICGEVSCIVKRDGQLLGFAKDPAASAAALDDFAPGDYWASGERDVLCLGAGGAGLAISLCLAQRARHEAGPRRFIAVDIAPGRLESMRAIHQKLDSPLAIAYRHHERAAENDALLRELAPGSLVINATGMGKDLPGSPITDAAQFPRDALVWELNYRGERLFMRQAAAQKPLKNLTIEAGWRYFLHGWTTALSEVFQFDLEKRRFDDLAAAASQLRA